MNRLSAGCKRKVIYVLAAAMLGLLLPACTGTVSGQVYLDKNQNSTLDSDETGVPYAKMIVTRDGKTVAEKYADSNGNFLIRVKQRGGQLCLKPDLAYAQDNLNFIQTSMGKAAKIKALTTETGGATGTTPGSGTGTGTGTGGTTVETTQTAKPEPAEGWVGDKYCRNYKGRNIEADIPVKIDYEEALSDMPTRLEVKCFAGAACEIKIPYPEGCKIDTLYLPEELSFDPATQPGLSFNTSLNSVSFEGTGTKAAAQKAETAAMPSVSVGTFKVAIVKTKVKDDAADTDLTINPSADCAGEPLDIQKIPVTIKRDINVTVSQDTAKILGLLSGEQVTVTVRIDNMGKSPIIDGVLTFTAPEGAAFSQALNTGCLPETSGKSKLAVCKIGSIASGEVKALDFKFTLPDVPQGQTEELTCSAQLTAKAYGIEVDAKDITLEVKKQ